MRTWYLAIFYLCIFFFANPQAISANKICVITDSANEADKYNKVFQPTCHNCYEKQYSSSLKKALDTAYNIELDIWNGVPTPSWIVSHNLSIKSNSNCSGQGNLSNCLRDINSWSNSHPNHDVRTVYLDKKDGWVIGDKESDLDNYIKKFIASSKLYTPADFKGGYSDLRAAAKANAWPTLGNLKGRIIFVLTGGLALNHNQTLEEYVGNRGNNAVMFVAPDTDEPSDITGAPNQFNKKNAKSVVFYNIKEGKGMDELAETTFEYKYISRVWGRDEDDLCALTADCVNAPGFHNWRKACFGITRGQLEFKDPAGWSKKQRESKSNFQCQGNEVMVGRWHDCGNKHGGKRCDENGDSMVYCEEVTVSDVAYVVGTRSWSNKIKESNGTHYLCPNNTVMTGRRHDCGNKDHGKKCDENGSTKYQCAVLSFEGKPVTINQNSGEWSGEQKESRSEFICPQGQVLNGRYHKGDENGKTKYHCLTLEPPNK